MTNLSPNDETLKIYNRKFEDYLRHTPNQYDLGHKPLLRWIDFSLSLLSPNSKIFEVGSGHGRDAKYINSKNFSILCSDGASAFVEYLNSHGQTAIIFNVLKDNFNPGYDMIFANAVAPHFTPNDMQLVLNKVYNYLPEDGVFAFNVKQGFGDEWINEKSIKKRFVHYWHPEEIRKLVLNSGFDVIFFEYDIPGGDLPEHTWIHITAQKK